MMTSLNPPTTTRPSGSSLFRTLAWISALLLGTGASVLSGEVNLVINPDYQHTYAARRLDDPKLSGVRSESRVLPGYEGAAFLPYGWSIVPQKDGQGVVSLVQEDGKSALRIRTEAGESITVSQGLVEVIPGATYTSGISVKGSGSVTLSVYVSEPAPGGELSRLTMVATPEWKSHRKVGQVGWHRHLAQYQLRITGKADLLIRGAEVSAEAASPAPGPSLFAPKSGQDPQAVLIESFDTAEPRIKAGGSARITGAGGGRFGRGFMGSSDAGGVRIPLGIGTLPKTGTLGFWFKPSVLPSQPADTYRSILELSLQSVKLGGGALKFFNSLNARGSMVLEFEHGEKADRISGPGWGWWQPDTWHHLAGSWDGEALRLYVDGVLSAITYKPGTEMPEGAIVDLLLAYAGVYDEICLSSTLSFGPVIPAGCAPVPFNTPEDPKAKAKSVTGLNEPTGAELDEQRAKRISAVPECRADYVFGIERMMPAWQGMEGVKVVTNFFGAGVNGLEVKVEAEAGRGVHVRLDGIEAGDYYVGLWTDSGDLRARTEYATAPLLASAYLNGWPVRFATAADPVQVRTGVWLTELQTATPVFLKAGDEIALAPLSFGSYGQRFLRLALYRKAPVPGHGVTGRTFGISDGKTPQRIRLVLQPELQGSGEDGTEHTAWIRIANPLPYAVDADVTWNLADYFGAPVEKKTETVHIEPHQVWMKEKRFVAQGDAQAYQLDVKTRAAKDFTVPFLRPVEWLDLNDWSRMEFLPDQPGPLVTWNHVRMNLAGNTSGERKFVCLDGRNWETAPMEGRRVPDAIPADLKFTRCTVPNEQSLRKDKFGVWYRLKFRAPEWMQGQKWLIELQGGTEETLFLNGRRVGTALSRIQGHNAYGYAQFTATDPSQALRLDGENELVFCVRGGVALVNAGFVDQFDSSDWESTLQNQDLHGRAFGTGVALSRVLLRGVPSVRVKQTLVMSEVEKGQIKIFARVANDDTQPHQVALKFKVFQNGQPLDVAIPDQTVELAPRSVKQVVVEAPAGTLIPYTPKNPVLARLETAVTEQGQTLERYNQRFGYRSIRVQGTGLVMNGQPVKLLGASFRSATEVFEGEDGVDIMRTGPRPQGWWEQWDLYDEIGYLHYPAVDVATNEGSWKKINNQTYWDDAKQSLVELIWTVGLHPCVVAWQLSNESYHYTPYFTGVQAQDKLGERIYSVIQHMRKEISPAIWCIADGDEDLGGRLDFCSFHYLNHGGSFYDFRKTVMNNTAETAGIAEFAHYPPDCFYLNGAAEIPRKGTRLLMNPDWVYGANACGDTESFWMTGLANGAANAKYIGDRAVVSTACQYNDARGIFWTKLTLDAYRDMEAITSGMYFTGYLGLMAPDVNFSMPQQAVRYYSGRRFERRVNIHDDEFRPGDLEFRWKMMDPAGKVFVQDQIRERSGTTLLARHRIAFDLPKVTQRTSYTLGMELWKDGRKCAAEERKVDVWPDLSAPAPRKALQGLVVFDPRKTVVPVLEKLGYAGKAIGALDAAALRGARVLVIGPDCVTKEMAPDSRVLQEFTRTGGRVLLLNQNDASLLPAGILLETRAWFSQGFVCSKNHPVMKGLADVDFQMWNPDHLIVKEVFRKPDKGNALTLVESFHLHRGAQNMQWSSVLEMYVGDGSILAVQLPLVERFDTEPMAAELLKRIMGYMSEPPFRKAGNQLAILGRASDGVLARLNDIRADYAFIDQPNPSAPVTLLDLNGDADKLPDAAHLRSYVEKGGILIVHRARPEHSAWLEALAGRNVTIEVQPYQGWVDKQMLERRDGLVEGLNNLDFYWRPQIDGEGGDSRQQISQGTKKGQDRGQVLYRVAIKGGTEQLFPGGLLQVPVGDGRLIIDQIKWEAPGDKMIGGSPARVISVMLTNLGILQKLPAPKPALPPTVTWAPVDLSSVVNRGLKDEKAGDGLGWKDWGPEQDLGDFQTGKVNLGGTPFVIAAGDKNCIVLHASKGRIRSVSDYPASVTIPVNRKNVAGLYFLHTGGWLGGVNPFAWREICYADGTLESIPLNGSNTGDWNYGHDDFPIEEVTTTTVAWKGSCKMYPVTRVYKTLWVNPHPEKEIKEVILTTRDLPEAEWRFLAHLGVTAALLPAGGAGGVAQRDAGRSNALLQEALKLRAENKTADAIGRLEAAIKADDQNAGAWKEFVAAQMPSLSSDAYIALCQKWIQTMPNCYEAYNVLGQFHEKNGRLQEALSNFNRSLEIEWNQPPAIQAKQRLEDALRK
jgi:hypothetical protein